MSDDFDAASFDSNRDALISPEERFGLYESSAPATPPRETSNKATTAMENGERYEGSAPRETSGMDVEASRRICEAAYRGRWLFDTEEDFGSVELRGEDGYHIGEVAGTDEARFIVHARQALPQALDEIDALTNRMDYWRRSYRQLNEEASYKIGVVQAENESLRTRLSASEKVVEAAEKAREVVRDCRCGICAALSEYRTLKQESE